MKGTRRLCPSCWSHNHALVLGCRQSPRRCALCGNELRPAPAVLGVNWKAILARSGA